jgi:PE family
MEPLTHNHPVANTIGLQVSANGARGLASGTAATAEATGLAPAGVDEVSLQAALAFGTEALETNMLNALAQQELARAGGAYSEASTIYTTVDEANAANLA